MNIKIKLFISAIAVVLSTSTGLAASNAYTQSGENVQYYRNHDSKEMSQNNRNGQYRDRQDNQPFNNQNDRNNGRNMRRNDHPRSFSRLPHGYRRVVARNRTYYTQDNDAYYSYNPYSRSYVLINFPGVSIRF